VDRVYITGVKGMLGRSLAPLLAERYDVFPRDLGEPDVRDAALIAREIDSCRPRFVFHLAAMTDVDACERDPEGAWRVNVDGTRNVARAARGRDAVLVYTSTGMTYNGTKPSPYVETDFPDPINAYGRSKYEGELAVRAICSRFYVFYTCWLFGGGPEDKKFVAKIVEKARTGGTLRAVDDKFGSPTYTVDLARAITSFMETGLYGKYHCANVGVASRLEMARVILNAARITGCELLPASSTDFPAPAPRPPMEALENHNFELLGLSLMRPWKEALVEYVEQTFA
jgi:dTDP-4-dehydrorhamnose reductase